jgi:AcrR family transcriptional regulator
MTADSADAEPSERRPAHRPSRQGEIVEAAVRVFSRNGLGRATMAEVARSCGMSPGGLYYHFPGKKDLFVAAVQSVADDLARLTGSGGAAPGTLSEVVQAVFDWSAANPERARLFFLVAPGSTPEIAETWAEFVDQHVLELHRYFPGRATEDGRWRGTRDTAIGDLAARTAIGLANAAALAWLAGTVFGEGTDRREVAVAVARAMSRLMEEGASERDDHPSAAQ